jgi:hypothetical protein
MLYEYLLPVKGGVYAPARQGFDDTRRQQIGAPILSYMLAISSATAYSIV